MKRANKSGSVSKLSGKRRRPYVVREGITGEQRTIGYAATSQEAKNMLSNFNEYFFNRLMKAKYFSEECSETKLVEDLLEECERQEDFFSHPIHSNLSICACCQKKILQPEFTLTFQEVFDTWQWKYWDTYGTASQKSYLSGYKYCNSLYHRAYKEITLEEMQSCITDCGKSYATQNSIKNLLSKLEQFSVEEWSDVSDIPRKTNQLKTSAIPSKRNNWFTPEEISILLENSDMEWVDSILFMMYTGCSLVELLGFKVCHVDCDSQSVFSLERDDFIPVTEGVWAIIENQLEVSGEYSENLFCMTNGKKVCESTYRFFWQKVMTSLEMTHTIKDCRLTFEKYFQVNDNVKLSGC